MDEIDFQAQFRPAEPDSAAAVIQRRLASPDLGELREAAEEREAEEERAERREQLAMLNQRHGNPLAELSRAQMQASEARELVDDLQAQLEKARGRLQRAAEAVVDFGHAVDDLHASTARRSDDGGVFAGQRQAARAAAADAMLERAAPGASARQLALQAAVRGQGGYGEVSRYQEGGWPVQEAVRGFRGRVTGWLEG